MLWAPWSGGPCTCAPARCVVSQVARLHCTQAAGASSALSTMCRPGGLSGTHVVARRGAEAGCQHQPGQQLRLGQVAHVARVHLRGCAWWCASAWA